MENSPKEKDCLDLENNNECCFFKVANAFLLLANMSLLIIGFYYLPSKNDNAYFSVIVAVLAILVTVLITWQIWQTINAEKRLRKIDKDIALFTDDVNDKIKYIGNKAHNLNREMLGVRLYCDATSSFSGANIRLLNMPENSNINEIIRVYKEVALSLHISSSIQHSGMLIPYCLDSLELSLGFIENTKSKNVFNRKTGNLLDGWYFDIIKIITENHQHRERLDAIRKRRLIITEQST